MFFDDHTGQISAFYIETIRALYFLTGAEVPDNFFLFQYGLKITYNKFQLFHTVEIYQEPTLKIDAKRTLKLMFIIPFFEILLWYNYHTFQNSAFYIEFNGIKNPLKYL